MRANAKNLCVVVALLVMSAVALAMPSPADVASAVRSEDWSKAESLLGLPLFRCVVLCSSFPHPVWVDVLGVVIPFTVVRRYLFSFRHIPCQFNVWLSIHVILYFIRPPRAQIDRRTLCNIQPPFRHFGHLTAASSESPSTGTCTIKRNWYSECGM